MAVLIPAGSADRSDAAVFAGRVARWDPTGPVRLVAEESRVTMWALTPFDVLVTRAVEATLQPRTVTVHASDLLAGLAIATADQVDPGDAVEGAWRSRMPPSQGWATIGEVPTGRVGELVRAGLDAARGGHDAAAGGHRAGGGTPVPPDVLDSEALRMTGEATRVTVPLRMLLALSGMGFTDDEPDGLVKIRATGAWLRLDAKFGAVVRRRLARLPLLV